MENVIKIVIRIVTFQFFFYPSTTLLMLVISREMFYKCYEINRLSITVFVVVLVISILLAVVSDDAIEAAIKEEDNNPDNWHP